MKTSKPRLSAIGKTVLHRAPQQLAKLPDYLEGMVRVRALVVLVIDLVYCAFSLPAAMYLRVGETEIVLAEYREALAFGVPVVVAVGAVVFCASGLYKELWRYISLPDVISLAKSVAVVVAISAGMLFVFTRLETMPRSVPFIQYLLLVAVMSGTRVVYREILLSCRLIADTGTWRVPALVVGVNATSELFIRAVATDARATFAIAAVLDIDGQHIGRTIHRVPVMGRVSDLAEVVRRLNRMNVRPQRILICETSNRFDKDALLSTAESMGMVVAYLPNLTEIRSGEDQSRPGIRLSTQDLLRRPSVVFSRTELARMIAGRRVLVTGAGGSIGSELCRQIALLGPAELILLDNSEYNLYSVDLELSQAPGCRRKVILADVRRRDRMIKVFHECKPELVFHAAALKHVPLAEGNPAETILTNTIGTRHVADAAVASGTLAFVQISTDKAVRPVSVMGASKRLAECYTQALDLASVAAGSEIPRISTRFITVRFGNVLGSSGSVVPLFQRQIANGGPLTVTHPEVRRYFMTIGEAVSLVLQASAYGFEETRERGRILVLEMGESVRIIDIARQLIKLSGHRPDEEIKIEITGLRPGEKLHEELFDPEEDLVPTQVSGILSARPKPISLAQLRPELDNLAVLAEQGSVTELRERIAVLLPSFGAPAPVEANDSTAHTV
jgi:FlaA1/EpsC-like NDP-sugar epimerase